VRCVLQKTVETCRVCIISRVPPHLKQWVRLMNWSGILRPQWKQTERSWGLRHVHQALNTLNSLAKLSDSKYRPINDTGLTALTSNCIQLSIKPLL